MSLDIGKRLIKALMLSISLYLFSCVENKADYRLYIMHGGIESHWDASIGWSYQFKNDGTVEFYEYDKYGKRTKASLPDDVIIDNGWNVNGNTLHIIKDFEIILAENDSLVLLDKDKVWGVDTLVYTYKPL